MCYFLFKRGFSVTAIIYNEIAMDLLSNNPLPNNYLFITID